MNHVLVSKKQIFNDNDRTHFHSMKELKEYYSEDFLEVYPLTTFEYGLNNDEFPTIKGFYFKFVKIG